MHKFVKYVAVTLSLLVLTACTMQGFAEKILPEVVQADVIKTIDAVMQKNSSAFESLQNEMSDEDFIVALDNMFTYVSDGAEMRRDIVAVSSNTSTSWGEGTNRTYTIRYEIQTENGFTVVNLKYVQTPEQQSCCKLQTVNVQNSETSPYRIPFAKAVKLAKIIGMITLIAIILLVTFLVRRSRSRRRN